MKNRNLLSFFLLLSILSCGTSDEAMDTCSDISVNELMILRVDSSGNASDLQITFDMPQEASCVDHYRILVVKLGEAASFDLQRARAVDKSNFIRIDKTATSIDTRLSSDAVDVNGDTLDRDENYALFVLSIGLNAADDSISAPVSFALQQKGVVEILTELPIGTGGIVVDENGNIYSADFGLAYSGNGGNLYKITPEGSISIFASGFSEPSGNTICPSGNIFQSDFSTGQVSQISMEGSVSTYATGMAGPVGLTFDSLGNLYVANCGNNTIKKVTPAGQVSTFASGSLFNCPNGITIDKEGNLYVANFRNANLIKVDVEGKSSLFASLPGNNLGHVIFFEDQLFVTARAANQIYEVSLEGDLTKIAGNGKRGHKTGSALEAEFSLPNDIGFSPDGTYIYINDAVQLSGVPVAPSYLKRIRRE
ncbi:MAG: hypothetical protein AAF849_09840 [Bacteroidota bacterium]